MKEKGRPSECSNGQKKCAEGAESDSSRKGRSVIEVKVLSLGKRRRRTDRCRTGTLAKAVERGSDIRISSGGTGKCEGSEAR